eukprot:gene9861-20508_t
MEKGSNNPKEDDSRNMLSWRVPNEIHLKPQDFGKVDSPTKSLTTENIRKLDVSTNIQSEGASEISSLESFLLDAKSPGPQSRLWRILFGNMNRWLDEVYNLCEDEKNEDRCVDVIDILDKSKLMFLKLLKNIESHPKHINHQQGGVSWEVCKTVRLKTHDYSIQNDEIIDNNNTSPRSQHSNSPRSVPARSILNYIPRNNNNSSGCFPSKLRVTAAPFVPSKSISSESLDTLSVDDSPAMKNNNNGTDTTTSIVSSQPSSSNNSNEIIIIESTNIENNNSRNITILQTLSSKDGDANASYHDTLPVSTTIVATSPSSSAAAQMLPKTESTDRERKGQGSVPDSVGPNLLGARQKQKQQQTTHSSHSSHLLLVNKSQSPLPSLSSSSPHGEDWDQETEEEVVEASERIWAAAEAWVEAEAIAEEEAWLLLRLETLRAKSKAREDSSSKTKMMLDTDISLLPLPLSSPMPHAHSPYPNPVPNTRASSTPSVSHVSSVSAAPTLTLDGIDDAYVMDSSNPGSHSPTFSLSPSASSMDLLLVNSNGNERTLFTGMGGMGMGMKFAMALTPERKKMSPEEARRKIEARQEVAEFNRSRNVSERKEKARVSTSRAKAIEAWAAQKTATAEQ